MFKKKKQVEQVEQAEPPMDNLPEGVIDWEEISAFIEDMLSAENRCSKGWWIINDSSMTESLKSNSVAVLRLLCDDLYNYFFKQHADRNEVWLKMEKYIRAKYGKLSSKALSRIITTYHIDDR